MIGNRDSQSHSPYANDGPNAESEALMDALADPLRRAVVRDLDPEEGRVALSDLVARVADDADVARSTAEIRLHHCHLPKLADLGLVAYDFRANAVEATPPPARTERRLDALLEL